MPFPISRNKTVQVAAAGDPLNPGANSAEPFLFDGQRLSVDPSQRVD